MNNFTKVLWRGFALAIALLFLIGSLLLPSLAAMAQPASPAPTAGLVKPTPTPNPNQPQAEKPEVPQTGDKADTPTPVNQPARADASAKRKAGTSGPYDVKAIEESYKSLYGS